MPEQRFVTRGRQVIIRTEKGKAELRVDNEVIPIRHVHGEPPFASPLYPYVSFDSLEKLARALVAHVLPGGSV